MKQKTPMQNLIDKIKSTPIGQINNLNFKDYLKDEKQAMYEFAIWYDEYGMRTESIEYNLEQFLNQLSNEQ